MDSLNNKNFYTKKESLNYSKIQELKNNILEVDPGSSFFKDISEMDISEAISALTDRLTNLQSIKNELLKAKQEVDNDISIMYVKGRLQEPIRGREDSKVYNLDDNMKRYLLEKLKSLGFNAYDVGIQNKSLFFENDFFMIRHLIPDCDCICGYNDEYHEKANKYYSEHEKCLDDYAFHSIDCPAYASTAVNFWFKLTNLKLCWDENILRGVTANQEVNETYLNGIFSICNNTIQHLRYCPKPQR